MSWNMPFLGYSTDEGHVSEADIRRIRRLVWEKTLSMTVEAVAERVALYRKDKSACLSESQIRRDIEFLHAAPE